MTQVLANFIQALRAADVRVSTSESIDAAAAVARIGFGHRSLLREALGQVLAKTPDDKHRFGACFDTFFTFEATRGETLTDDAAPPAAEESAAERQPAGGGSGAGGGGLADLLAGDDPAAIAQAVAVAAREVQLQNIRLFTQRGQYVRRILEFMGIEEMEAAFRAQPRQQPDDPRRDQIEMAKARLVDDVIALVDRQIALYTANAGRTLHEEILQQTPLTRIELRDFRLMHGLVQKLAKRLVSLHSRRRRVANRGQLDVRNTLRHNLAHDGLLVEPRWKRVKVDRPKIVAVCDVSGSVAQASRFLLMFLYSMSEVLPKVRSFAFSNQLGEVTEQFRTLPVESAIAAALAQWGMGSTDYGGAFAELERLAGQDIDHRTTILILGDARANYGDPGHRTLRRLHARARRVLWLNPEPRSLWNVGDSAMRALGACCDRVEPCRTLTQLERIVGEVARTAV